MEDNFNVNKKQNDNLEMLADDLKKEMDLIGLDIVNRESEIKKNQGLLRRIFRRGYDLDRAEEEILVLKNKYREVQDCYKKLFANSAPDDTADDIYAKFILRIENGLQKIILNCDKILVKYPELGLMHNFDAEIIENEMIVSENGKTQALANLNRLHGQFRKEYKDLVQFFLGFGDNDDPGILDAPAVDYVKKYDKCGAVKIFKNLRASMRMDQASKAKIEPMDVDTVLGWSKRVVEYMVKTHKA